MTDDPYLHYLDEFGERLAAAAAADDAQRAGRPRLGRRLLPAGGLAVVVAVAALLLTGGTGGGHDGGLDAVAQARAALAPQRAIVHMVITSSIVGRPASVSGSRYTTEQWSAVDPGRWRLVQGVGSPAGRDEIAYTDGRLSHYAATPDELSVIRGYSDRGAAAQAPGPFGGDPPARLRALLSSGRARDLGIVRLGGGRTVRRLVITRHTAPADLRRLDSRLVYDVDPTSFAPVGGRIVLGVRGVGTVVTRFTVDRYERLPLTAANLRLLRIATMHRTHVAIRDLVDVQRRLARLQGHCVRRRDGDKVCGLRPGRRPRPPEASPR